MAERLAVNEDAAGSNPASGAMDKDKEYAKKVTKETVSFLDTLKDAFDLMGELTPEEDRKLWDAAFEEAKEGIGKAQEELENATPEQQQKIAERKPPALWELEKTMMNRAAEEAGLSPIKDADEQEEDGTAVDEEEGA